MDASLLLSALVVTLSAAACVYAWRRELDAPLRIALLAIPVLLVLMAALAWANLPILTAAALASVITICVLICEIDRRHFIIPDVLVLALLLVALAAPFTSRSDQVLGALITGGIFFAVRLGFRSLRGAHGLGLGDVKLAAVMGALLGPSLALVAVAIAAGTTALILAARKATTAGTAQQAAPFGVGLSAALMIALVFEAWR